MQTVSGFRNMYEALGLDPCLDPLHSSGLRKFASERDAIYEEVTQKKRVLSWKAAAKNVSIFYMCRSLTVDSFSSFLKTNPTFSILFQKQNGNIYICSNPTTNKQHTHHTHLYVYI